MYIYIYNYVYKYSNMELYRYKIIHTPVVVRMRAPSSIGNNAMGALPSGVIKHCWDIHQKIG